MKSSYTSDNYRALNLLRENLLERGKEVAIKREESADAEPRTPMATRSALRHKTRSDPAPPAPQLNLPALIRFQARVRGALARAETQRIAYVKHAPVLLARKGKRVKGQELAWISVLQFVKSEDWVIHIEEIEGRWRLEAKVGPHHAWRLFDLASVVEGLDLTEDNQMVFNSDEKKSNVQSELIQDGPPPVFCKRLCKLSGKSYTLTARVDKGGIVVSADGATRDKIKPLVWSGSNTAEMTVERLEEELEALMPRLILQNKRLQLGTPREPQREQLSLKLTNKVQSTDSQLLAAGRRRIKGRWFSLSLVQKTASRLNTTLTLYELEAKADEPSDLCLLREYQLSEILSKLNLWSSGEIVEMGEELFDHVQIDGKTLDLTKEKCGYTATKQELLTVTKTLNNQFDYELVFLYDVASPTNLTVEAHHLDNSPPIERPLELDLNEVREQYQLGTGKLTNEDLGKIVDMINLLDGGLALLQPSSAAPVPTVPIRDGPHSDDSSDASSPHVSTHESVFSAYNEFQLRAIIRMQAYFRMQLAKRSWDPIKNPSTNLLYRKCRIVKSTSYVVSIVRARGVLHMEALRMRDWRILTKDISHPAAYAFGYSKIEDLKLLVDSLTEFEGKLGLRKGKRPGKSVSSINISELDMSYFRDEEEEKNTAANRLIRLFRRHLFRKRFRKVIEESSRKLLFCKRKDLGDGMSLLSIFQEDNELTLEICDPTGGKPWKVQRMRLDLSALGDPSAHLELILDNLRFENGTVITPSRADLNLPDPPPKEPDPLPTTDVRNQLITRVRDFAGQKAVVTANIVLKLPAHSEPLPTDDLEFELTPSLTDPPTKAVISVAAAGNLLGLPLDSIIPIANLTISKLLKTTNGQLEIDTEVKSPVIDMEKLTNSIQAIARGFLVRARYGDSLRQLKSYLVAMTLMKFFDEPFIVYAYHLEDKYKIEAVHRRLKYAVMLLIDEGLIRRFKFSASRKKIFEEAVFPRLYMIEENDMYRLCLNPHVNSDKTALKGLRSSKNNESGSTHQRTGSAYFTGDDTAEEVPIPRKLESDQKPQIIARGESIGRVDVSEVRMKLMQSEVLEAPPKGGNFTAKPEARRVEIAAPIIRSESTKVLRPLPQAVPVKTEKTEVPRQIEPAKVTLPRPMEPAKVTLSRPENPLSRTNPAIAKREKPDIPTHADSAGKAEIPRVERPLRIETWKNERPPQTPSSESVVRVEFASKAHSMLSSIKSDHSDSLLKEDSLVRAEVLPRTETVQRSVVPLAAIAEMAGKYELLPRPGKTQSFVGVADGHSSREEESELRTISVASTKPQFSISKLSQSDRLSVKPPLLPPKPPVVPLSPDTKVYHLDVVVRGKKSVPDKPFTDAVPPRTDTEETARAGSVPTDDIRRVRRLQAMMKPSNSVAGLVRYAQGTKETEGNKAKGSELGGSGRLSINEQPLFRKAFVPPLKSGSMRSMSTKSLHTAPKSFHKRGELIFKTGHHISDTFCVVSFYRSKKSTLKVEAVDSNSSQRYACKVAIDPTLTGRRLDEHCETMLDDLRIVQSTKGKWKLGFAQQRTPRLGAEEDVDFFVV